MAKKNEPQLLETSASPSSTVKMEEQQQPVASSSAKKEPRHMASSSSAKKEPQTVAAPSDFTMTSSRSRQPTTVQYRALNERMYLLSRLAPEDGEATFLVAGASGKLYTVRLPVCLSVDARPRCNCPDFIFRKRACKHIQFVALRVLKLRQPADITLDSLADAHADVAQAVEAHLAPASPAAGQADDVMAPGEVQRAFEMVVPAHMRPSNRDAAAANPAPAAATVKEEDRVKKDLKKEEKEEDHGVPIKPPENGDECPICFEDFDKDDFLYCRTGCGKPVHSSCMVKYAHSVSDVPRCVLCRTPWEFGNSWASRSHSHSHSHASPSGDGGGHGYGSIGGLLSQQTIDRRRGMLINGRLIDLSIVARNSFVGTQRTSYAYEEEEEDDNVEEEVNMNMTGESQSEKAARQKSERAARARRREAQPAADIADESSEPVQTQPRATRSRAGRSTGRSRAETTSASTPKKGGKKKAPATHRKTLAPRKAQPERRSTRTRASARTS